MANMTLTFPDAVAPRIVEALSARGGWTPEVGAATGQTQNQAAKAVVVDFIKTVSKHYEAEKDAAVAREQALTKAEADFTVT
jgi:hypothetical protein